MTKIITWDEVFRRLAQIDHRDVRVYGVPKGGMIAAGFLRTACSTHIPESADIILDDLIDSGTTRTYYIKRFPEAKFVSLYKKKKTDGFVVFPWEADHPSGADTIHQNVARLIQYIGEDPKREGLKETPTRVINSWKELFSGYSQDPAEVFKVFQGEGYDQIILLKDIEMFSMCEHHLSPFFGKAHVAYIPGGKVIGVSKLARLVEIYARRLQIQERIGGQVTDALMQYLKPKGAACIIEAVHMCMRMRGVSKQHSMMVTSSLKGVFLHEPSAKAELLQLIGRYSHGADD